jgi:DNA helicase-2/ATP-dependent DNA helicase PcrA
MTIHQTEEQEKEHLKAVLKALKETINYTDKSVKRYVDTLNEHKNYLWTNKDIDAQEVRSMRESILNHLALGENVISLGKRLKKLLDRPYFGRIDFRENKPEAITTQVYIGIHSFYNPKNNELLIYDWRAPISGMFYDYELGNGSYNSPNGEVTGIISLKRQYLIKKGILEFMLESSLTVHDEVLQKELSANSDDRMKNIVATIQREQNKIIRNDEASTLIIQGVAGSGKTSVAMHRIAYLLYKFKGELSADEILIISPNKVFSDYISNVLPELGEERVPETSMEEILSNVLENRYKYQRMFEQIAEIIDNPDSDFAERVKYKSSLEFISKLNSFLHHIKKNCFKAVDVKLNKHFTIPSEYIEEQFQRFDRYPIRQRFEVMTEYILDIAKIKYRIDVTSENRKFLKKELKKMFKAENDLIVYKSFYEWLERPKLFKFRKNRTLEYADLAPLAYIHLALEGNNPGTAVKHLLIDEMQDYSPIQYKVILKLYPCRKTILGDIHQSVNPYGSSDAETINRVFLSGEIMRLNKSYRSTYEIAGFASKLRPHNQMEVIERHGEEPVIIKCKSNREEIETIERLIVIFKASGLSSLGIICKNELQAESLYNSLSSVCRNIHYLSHRSSSFVNGIVVTSSYIAKGLEFDEVIIPEVSKNNYKTDFDKNMLYVAVTRAMHRLTLTYTGKLTKYIEDDNKRN